MLIMISELLKGKSSSLPMVSHRHLIFTNSFTGDILLMKYFICFLLTEYVSYLTTSFYL